MFKRLIFNPIIYVIVACVIIFIITLFLKIGDYENESAKNIYLVETELSQAIISNEPQKIFKLISNLKVDVVKCIEVVDDGKTILSVPNKGSPGCQGNITINVPVTLSGIKIATIKIAFNLLKILYYVLMSPILIFSVFVAAIMVFLTSYIPLKKYRQELEAHLGKLREWAADPSSQLDILSKDRRYKDKVLAEIVELVESGVEARINLEVSLKESQRKQKEIELKSEKDSAVANITKTIVHDIRNPLGTVEFVMKSENWDHFLKLKPRLWESYLKINAMLENIRYGQVEFIVKQAPRELDFLSTIDETKLFAQSRNVSLEYSPY